MSEYSLQTICAVKRQRDEVRHLSKFQLYLYKQGEEEQSDYPNISDFYDKYEEENNNLGSNNNNSLTCCTTTDSIGDVQDFFKSYTGNKVENTGEQHGNMYKRGRRNSMSTLLEESANNKNNKVNKFNKVNDKKCTKSMDKKVKERLLKQMNEFRNSISFVKSRRFVELNKCEANLKKYLCKFGLLPDNCTKGCEAAKQKEPKEFAFPSELLKDNDKYKADDLVRYNACFLYRTTRNIFEDFERKRADEMTKQFEGYCRRNVFVLPDVSAFEEHTEFTSRYII